jgi:HEAT repeat protein
MGAALTTRLGSGGVIISLIAALAACAAEEKKQTPAEWLQDNTIILRQLQSYDQKELHEGISRFLRLGKERGTEVVHYILNDPKLDDYRIEVVLARILAEWKDSRAIKPLLLSLKEQDSGAVLIAKEGLMAFGDSSEIRDAVKEYLNEPEPKIRRVAAEILSEMKGPEAAPLLAERYRTEDDVEVRGFCLMGILTSRYAKRTAFLVEALDDKDSGIRQQAWEAVVILGPPVGFEPNADTAQRVRAVDALRRWAESKART